MKLPEYIVIEQWGAGMAYIRAQFESASAAKAYAETLRFGYQKRIAAKTKGARPSAWVFQRIA